MNSTFTVLNNSPYQFIGNKETGRWVLAKSIDDKIENQISSLIPKRQYTGISTILLNVTRKCNFECKYCCIGNLRNTQTNMSEEVGIRALDRISEIDIQDRYVIFHGSEPMMNFPLIESLVNYSNSKNYQIRFAIQSNGSLFNDMNIDFLTRNKVWMGISLDGKKEHQNQTRPYLGGHSSYEDVIKNMPLISQKQGGLSIITVVTSTNVGSLVNIVKHFEDSGVNAVSFSPLSHSSRSLQPNVSEFSRSLIKVFDRYFEAKTAERPTIEIDNIRKYLLCFLPKTSPSNCVQCTLGSRYPLVGIDVDGEIYPCDFFWGNKEFSMGNVFNNTLEEATTNSRDFRNNRDIDKIKRCSSCNWKRFCGGGCPGSPFMEGKSLERASRYCQLNKTMLTYLAEKLPMLYEKGLVADILR